MSDKPVRIERLVVGQLQTNCYLVIDGKTQKSLIIDPGDDAEYISGHLNRLKSQPQMIVATHGHFDHLLAARALQLAYNIPFGIHGDDVFLVRRMRKSLRHFLGISGDPPPTISRLLREKQKLRVGAITLDVLHTPGHTPGSVCFSLGKVRTLFVGDLIFADGAVGRTDFSYSNKNDLKESIGKIFSFPADSKLLPGHGEATVITDERLFHKVQ